MSRYQTVLLDRDGVINRMRTDYVKSWDEFELLPSALDAIACLGRGGRDVVVLTNQSAIGQQLVSRETVDEIHSRLAALVADHGGRIRAFLVCPHTRDDGCVCRKPAPGLLWRARDELGVALDSAVMVGDQVSDVMAAWAAGCESILVDPSGHEAASLPVGRWAVVESLAAAADLICGE
jgi:histidinol-phosphate phosphatase family protein